MRYKLGASLVISVLVVVLVEVALRLSGLDTTFQNRFFILNRDLDYPEVFDRDCDLFWRLRPGQTVTSRFFEGKTYRINEQGLRGPEIPPVKNEKRILLMGNSCMFGWGVSGEQSTAGRLGQRLDSGFLVINAGVPGYSSLQGLRLLERDLVLLRPDYVVAMYGWNDEWAAAGGIADKDQKSPPRPLVAAQNMLARWHTYRLLKKLLLSVTEPDIDSLWSRTAPVYRVSLDDFRTNLLEICRTAERFNAVPILVTEPQPSNLEYGAQVSGHPAVRQHERYNDVVLSLARDEGFVLVDAAREFERYGNLYDNARRDFIHFNAAGHAVLADLLAGTIRSLPDSTPASR